jgi:hypothetical protein
MLYYWNCYTNQQSRPSQDSKSEHRLHKSAKVFLNIKRVALKMADYVRKSSLNPPELSKADFKSWRLFPCDGAKQALSGEETRPHSLCPAYRPDFYGSPSPWLYSSYSVKVWDILNIIDLIWFYHWAELAEPSLPYGISPKWIFREVRVVLVDVSIVYQTNN